MIDEATPANAIVQISYIMYYVNNGIDVIYINNMIRSTAEPKRFIPYIYINIKI